MADLDTMCASSDEMTGLLRNDRRVRLAAEPARSILSGRPATAHEQNNRDHHSDYPDHD